MDKISNNSFKDDLQIKAITNYTKQKQLGWEEEYAIRIANMMYHLNLQQIKLIWFVYDKKEI